VRWRKVTLRRREQWLGSEPVVPRCCVAVDSLVRSAKRREETDRTFARDVQDDSRLFGVVRVGGTRVRKVCTTDYDRQRRDRSYLQCRSAVG